MALIVEDGSGLPNAESYASVQNFKDYYTNRGIDISAFTPDTKIEELLRLATDFMVQQYRPAWKGLRFSVPQALDWPRWDVILYDQPGGYGGFPFMFPINQVPKEVVTACIVLAYKAFFEDGNDLSPDIDRVTSSEKIDVIEIVYDKNSAPVKTFRSIGAMLAPYLSGSGANGSIATLIRS